MQPEVYSRDLNLSKKFMELKSIIKLLSVLILSTFPLVTFSQDDSTEKEIVLLHAPVLKDMRDVINNWFNIRSAPNSYSIEKNKLVKTFLPIIGYTPANGFLVGVGISGNILLGDPATTKISSVITNINVTSKRQLVINLRSNIYSNNNRWIFQGDMRMLFFTQDTYGLGVNFKEREPLTIGTIRTPSIPGPQSMNFNYVRLHQMAYRNVGRALYLGGGYNLDHHYNIVDKALDTAGNETQFSDHFVYSVNNKFPTKKYTTSGVVLGLLWDSRDNSIFTHSGQYAALNFRVNPTLLGSERASSRLFGEYRAFIPVSKLNQNKVLGFWFWQSILTSGDQPYLALPSITWDMYNRSGRGYIQGRLRGENFAYAESEYRFPITKNGLFSGVAFANISTASDEATKQKVYTDFAPGYGFGLRLKMDKRTHTNLSIDYGRGRNGSSGIYFNLQETF